MNAAPAYSERVRALFARPAHAGDAAGPRVDLARGDSRIVLSAELADDGRLARLAFRAFGCPHLIAAAEAACAACEGRETGALAAWEAGAAFAELAVPLEKTGRILLLEDAIRALHEKLTASVPGRN